MAPGSVKYACSMDSALLETALRAVAAAEQVLLRHWETGVSARLKADRSPVSIADEEAEKVIRAELLARFPDHGFHGEEYGRERPDAEYLWLIDPLDGTKSFLRRQPFWSTQLALLHDGQRVLGVSNAPRFAECVYATRGGGAFLGDRRLSVSTTPSLAQAAISTGNLRTLAQGDGWAGLGRLVAAVDRTRGFGDFYHYHQLALGAVDVVLESDVNILDVAALATIVDEAGGRATALDGTPLTTASTTILATNGALHEQVLEVLWS